MASATTTGQVAEEYCRRYPRTPSLQLARMMYGKEKPLFRSIEHARTSLRYVRGAKGKLHHQQIKHAARLVRRIVCPPARPCDYKGYDLPDGIKRWLFLSDVHIPYHDQAALNEAVRQGQKARCDGLLLLGDFMDFYNLSKFCKDPRERRFPDELAEGVQALDWLRATLKPKAFIWKYGNHEARLDTYVMDRAPELFGIEGLTLDAFCKLKERGIQWIPEHCHLQYHRLSILHGHEIRLGYNAVSPARAASLKTGECTVVGHAHRKSEQPETNILGESKRCWSLGCLCQLHPKWLPENKWTHGYAILDTTTPSGWSLDNRAIHNGVTL